MIVNMEDRVRTAFPEEREIGELCRNVEWV